MLVGSNHPPAPATQGLSGSRDTTPCHGQLLRRPRRVHHGLDVRDSHQVHRGTNQQDVSKYVNSLMSLGRHLQLQEFRTWLNDRCGMPIAVRPSDVNLAEYMDTEQIEAWINEWTQNHASDRSGKIFRLFLQHEFKVDVKDSMKLCNGCDQPYSSFLLMPVWAYKAGTYDPLDYHLFCYTCCTSTSGLLSPDHWLREHPEHQAHQRLLAMAPAPASTSIHPMADHTTIPEQPLAPPQSDRCSSTTTIPHQGLGDPSSAPRGTTIPLPDDPGTHRPRQTTSQVYTRRRFHLAKVGRAPTTVCPLAIPATIPHTPPRWPMATHHALTTRKAHGVPRSLHPTHRHTHHGRFQEHDAWKHLAPTHSDMDALSSSDLSPEHSHPTRSPIHQHPEDDRIVESLSLFSTVGTTPTRPGPPLHATNGLDPTPTLGKATSPK